MTQHTPDSGWHEDDESLLQEELNLGDQNPSRAADAVMVHALLTLLAPGDAERTQARVRRAMATIRDSSARRSRFQIARWVRRGTAAAILTAASTALAILVFHVEETSATATLDRLLSTTASLTNRSYSFAMRENFREQGFEQRATLDLGEAGRFRFSAEETPYRIRPVFGYNGDSYWMELPNGRFARSKDAGPLQSFLGTDEDGDSEVLTLESVLDTLRGGYDLDVSQRVARAGSSILTVTATRRGSSDWELNKRSESAEAPPQHPRRGNGLRGRERPSQVTIDADPNTFEVLSLVADWRGSDGQPKRQVEIALEGPHNRSTDWFDPALRGLKEIDPDMFWRGDMRPGGNMRPGGDMRQGGDLRQGGELRPGGEMRAPRGDRPGARGPQRPNHGQGGERPAPPPTQPQGS